jgi:uncharacterized protein (TIGR03790 family)
MRKMTPVLAGVLAAGVSLLAASRTALAAAGDRVLVVYSSNWTGDLDGDGVQDSLQVANYYASKRGVPAANVFGVACSTGVWNYYYTSYTDFYNEMVTPIKTKLTALGPANIDIILLCYGIPSIVPNSAGGYVSLDNAMMGLNHWSAASNDFLTKTEANGENNPYLEFNPTFGADHGHFDHAAYKFHGTEMYLVTRLEIDLSDHSSVAGLYKTLSMVDQALYGERYISPQAGYYNGYAYVDSGNGQPGGSKYTDAYLAADPDVQTGSYNNYGLADKNMAFAERFVNNAGFTLKWENTPGGTRTTIGDQGAFYSDGTRALTAPRALFYGGWYNFGRYNDVWEWLPGSVACDLNSDSGTDFGRSAMARGCTAFCGVVGEPYLNGHPRPHTLYYYILNGYNFAEASALATPYIGWMPVNFGDPLYTPLKAKALVKDTQFPVLAAGYPKVSGAAASNTRTITVKIADAPEPEVVRVTVEYGFTSSYGVAATSQGYWKTCQVDVNGLQGNATYHYRLKLTDPVGNVTTTGDYTFTTAAAPKTAPVAQNQSAMLGHDTSKAIALVATDADGNALTFNAGIPAHGTVTISGSMATYTPAAGYSGQDSFTFTATDGALDSNAATVSLTVMPTAEVTVVLQQGLSGYAGARDTMISNYGSGYYADTNYGGDASMTLFSNGDDERILVAFDVSAIPADATILSARMELYCSSISWAPGFPVRVYRLTHSWTEGASAKNGATYREYTYTDGATTTAGDWPASGGDYDQTVQAEVSTTDIGSLEWINWDISGLVQGWVNGMYANNGALIFHHGDFGLYSFFTKEYTGDAALRPKLTISYFPANASGNPVYGDANGDGGFSLADVNQMVDWLLIRATPPASGSAKFVACDVNGDGSLSLADLNLFVDRLLGRVTKFPVE